MNKVEVYVKNIKSDKVLPSGCHELICDTDSWGHIVHNRRLILSPTEYESVKRHGYFMG